MKFKAVIFDMDGTLIDSETNNYIAWKEFLGEYKFDIDLNYYSKNFVGQSKEYIAKMCEELVGLNYLEIIQAKDLIYKRVSIERPAGILPFGLEILENLKQMNIIIGLATGAGRDEAMGKLERLDLVKYFDAIVTKSDVTNTKPDPETYISCMNKLRIKPEETLAVEDSLAGFQSAIGAGIETLVVENEMNMNIDFGIEKVKGLKGVWGKLASLLKTDNVASRC